MEIKLNYNHLPHLTLNDLREHNPQKDYFVGIDSDGTIFDSMELKHKDCFVGSLIRVFDLVTITHEIHMVWNYVNIFSKTRGTNRFKALILTFNYLREMDRVKQLQIQLPILKTLEDWINESKSLSNESLINLIADLPLNEKLIIKTVLEWSEEVNRVVKKTVFNLPPMKGALNAIDSLIPHADLVVISNTPLDTLNREWSENNIISKVLYIGGQETGTKTEMLMCAAKDKYEDSKILIIGDSPGDLNAAKNINALFYPILPTREYYSWDVFNADSCNDFLNGEYVGHNEKNKIDEFESILKLTPTWMT